MLVPDGAYTFAHGQARFHRAPAPSEAELERLLDILIRRITRTLVRTGVLVKDPQQPWIDIHPDSGGDSTLEHRARAPTWCATMEYLPRMRNIVGTLLPSARQRRLRATGSIPRESPASPSPRPR